MNSRQVVARWRCGAGGTRCRRRAARTTEALTVWPSLRSSPRMRRCPQRAFSRANRRMSAAISAGIAGQPVLAVYSIRGRLLALLRSQCQNIGPDGLNGQHRPPRPRTPGEARDRHERSWRADDLVGQERCCKPSDPSCHGRSVHPGHNAGGRAASVPDECAGRTSRSGQRCDDSSGVDRWWYRRATASLGMPRPCGTVPPCRRPHG